MSAMVNSREANMAFQALLRPTAAAVVVAAALLLLALPFLLVLASPFVGR